MQFGADLSYGNTRCMEKVALMSDVEHMFCDMKDQN
jgi:hypothetical protein